MKAETGRFQIRPVEIDAVQYKGDNSDQVVAWIHSVAGDGWRAIASGDSHTLLLNTARGVLVARPGDWVLWGLHGNIDVCDEHRFATFADEVPTDFYV